MTASSWAGVITAIATLLTALGGLVVTYKVMIPNKKTNEDTHAQVEQVHTIVNQQRSDMLQIIKEQGDWNRALVRALKLHNIEVPIDQSVPDIEGPDEIISRQTGPS